MPFTLPNTMLFALACAIAVTSQAEDPLTQADLSAGDVSIAWHTARGMTVRYRGVDVFDPYSTEFTVHDRKWTRAFFSSSKSNARATVQEQDGTNVLEIKEDAKCFAYTKRVTVMPGSKLVVEYEFGQSGLADAHLQLGWRPSVPWLDGAAYQVSAQGELHEGRMTYGKAKIRVLWSGLREMRFASPFGTWHLKTSHEMTLYDDRDKGSFFLGWDQPLEKGKRYREVVELELSPPDRAIGGVMIADFDWTRESKTGDGAVTCRLSRTEDGPRELKLRLEALLGSKTVSSTRSEVSLTENPLPIDIRVPLAKPGRYALRLLAFDADREVLRVQGLPVQAKSPFRFMPSLSLYTHEKKAELIVQLAEDIGPGGLIAELAGDALPARTIGLKARETIVPLDLGALPDGMYRVTCVLKRGEAVVGRGEAKFAKAPAKPNEVKIDYRSRGLIVDGKPFFPFGFYIHRGRFYDDKDPQYVLRLEGAHKFNLICVYHNFSNQFRREKRQAIAEFLDRADAVGMRAHYDVRQLTDQEPSDEVSKALAEEAAAHAGSPALLCWYLSDEPAGRRVPPDRYIQHNAHLKQLDPHHPTTMVFCVPGKAHEYADGMDILMVDPYPIPNRSVATVAETVDLVLEATGRTMPVWCVPQAFGGGEWWAREPTWQEQRCMTYLAIVHGATGIQYFIRRPPHNNPFVDGMWAECRKIAAEIKELTPVLLSHESMPNVVSEDASLHLTARQYDGEACLLCVNTDKQPKAISLKCDRTPIESRAVVLFEDRTVPVSSQGEIQDLIDALGVRVYSYRVAPAKPNKVVLPSDSLIRNGGFETQTNPGFPDAFRVSYTQETGASWGTDPLEAIEGRHSLFIRCPADGQGISVSSYPMKLKPGRHVATFHTKADRQNLRLHCALGKTSRSLDVGKEWQKFATELDVPEGTRWVHFTVRPETRGVVWVDAIQVHAARQEG